MGKLFDRLMEICLLRKGPQDLPYSHVLLGRCALGYGLLGLWALLIGIGAGRWLASFALTLVDMGVIAGLSYAVLNRLGHGGRLIQTLTALFGTGALFQIAVLPLIVWQNQALDEHSDPSLPFLLSQGLAVWGIIVMGHILQQAFSTSRGIGVLYALGYFLLITIVGAGVILPPPSP